MELMAQKKILLRAFDFKNPGAPGPFSISGPQNHGRLRCRFPCREQHFLQMVFTMFLQQFCEMAEASFGLYDIHGLLESRLPAYRGVMRVWPHTKSWCCDKTSFQNILQNKSIFSFLDLPLHRSQMGSKWSVDNLVSKDTRLPGVKNVDLKYQCKNTSCKL